MCQISIEKIENIIEIFRILLIMYIVYSDISRKPIDLSFRLQSKIVCLR